jgi:hypothetical protein
MIKGNREGITVRKHNSIPSRVPREADSGSRISIIKAIEINNNLNIFFLQRNGITSKEYMYG